MEAVIKHHPLPWMGVLQSSSSLGASCGRKETGAGVGDCSGGRTTILSCLIDAQLLREDMPLLSSSSLQIRFYMSPYIEWEVGYWVWAVVAAEAGDHDQNLMESVHAALQGLVQGWGLVPHYWMLIGRPGATEAEHDMAREGKGPERPPDDCTDNMMRTGHCLYCASTCQDLREHFLGAHGWTHGRHGRSLGHSCPAA